MTKSRRKGYENMSRYDIGMDLKRLSNLIMRYTKNHLCKEKEEIDKITGTNGWIIAYLMEHQNEDVYQKDLEKAFCVTRSTASKVINLMVKKGFIERQTVPSDARLKKLVLTSKAEAISQHMKENQRRISEELVKGFSEEEINLMHNFIERMKDNIGG